MVSGLVFASCLGASLQGILHVPTQGDLICLSYPSENYVIYYYTFKGFFRLWKCNDRILLGTLK